MKRRKKNTIAAGAAAARTKKTIGQAEDSGSFRFKVSLVFLIAALLAASLLLLLGANRFPIKSKAGQCAAGVALQTGTKIKNNPTASGTSILDDASLDFKITVPNQIGNWVFKTGYIKSPVEDSLSDQYVQIFLPVSGKDGSKNFEERYSNILTIKKFSSSEWKKLESGCQKDNSLYCDMAGSKIEEKGSSVYSYSGSKDCPQELKSKCQLADKIVETFTLK